MKWQGVIPAITTLQARLSVDADCSLKQVDALVRAGCTGIVALAPSARGARSPSTRRSASCACAARARRAGRRWWPGGRDDDGRGRTPGRARRRSGLRRPHGPAAYVYRGDWRETPRTSQRWSRRLPSSACSTTTRSRTHDVLPEQVLDLAASLPNLVAVKESSADVRRVTSCAPSSGPAGPLRRGGRPRPRGVQAGATGWIAGLADALPAESVRLFDLATRGGSPRPGRSTTGSCPCSARHVPRFVQLIKLVQQETGSGRRPCARRASRSPRRSARRSSSSCATRSPRPALG